MTARIIIDKMWDGVTCPANEHATVTLRRAPDGLRVHVDAPFFGDPRPESPPGSVWELWNYEVVELFIVGVGDPIPYLEIELGPHGHYLVLQLRGIRQIVARELPLSFTAHIHGDRWTGEAHVPTAWLPAGATTSTLTANAVAIHGEGEGRRYLSSTPLPGEAPDFHRIESFGQVDLG